MNLYDFLLAGEPSEDSVALVDGANRPWSYGELRTGVEHLSGYIEQTSEPQDRCLIFAANSFLWVCSYLAILRAGRVAVPVPAAASDELLQRIIRSCGPRLAFVDSMHIARARCVTARDLVLVSDHMDESDCVDFDEALAFLPMEQSLAADEGELAALMFTSGSTGEPRAVMLTHRNLAASTTSLVQHMDASAADRILVDLPLSYCFGTLLLQTQLRVGGSVVVDDWAFDPQRTLDRLRQTACTGLGAGPTSFRRLASCEGLPGTVFPHLHRLQHFGGKIPAPLLQQIRAAFPSQQLEIMYGQTEAAGAVAAISMDLLNQHPGSIGAPLPGITMKLLDEQGATPAAGEVGEIVVEGPAVARGYWLEHDASRRTFRNGRLYTGDLATSDKEGFYTLAGRARDFLKLGGQRIEVSHIERVISSFPGVSDVAVISKHDEVLGETVVLFVIHSRGEEMRHELADYCATHLPFSQRPREIHFRAHLPRDLHGKPDRRLLLEELMVQVTPPPFLEQLQVGRDLPAPS